MNLEQLRMLQQMQGAQQMPPQQIPMPLQQMPRPQQQGGGKPKQVPWYDRFGWWTVILLLLVGGLITLAVLPPLK